MADGTTYSSVDEASVGVRFYTADRSPGVATVQAADTAAETETPSFLLGYSDLAANCGTTSRLLFAQDRNRQDDISTYPTAGFHQNRSRVQRLRFYQRLQL